MLVNLQLALDSNFFFPKNILFSKILVPTLGQVPGLVPFPKLEPGSSSGSKKQIQN